MPLRGHGVSFERSVGAGPRAMGGAAAGLDISALAGDADLVTAFDDFNQIITNAAALGTAGWTATVLNAGAATEADINGRATQGVHQSSLFLNGGTSVDAGLNLQLNDATMPTTFGHLWLPSSAVDTMDNADVILACRVGLVPNDVTWQGKAFIGWARTGDTQIMVFATGALETPSTGALLGFHVRESGEITLVSLRANQAVVAADEATLITAASWNAALNVGVPVWFDLALRVRYRDASDAANNGAVQGWAKRVVDQRPGGWGAPRATITNRLPFDAAQHVPTVEIQNGGVGPAGESDLFTDWWAMGLTRFSARG